ARRPWPRRRGPRRRRRAALVDLGSPRPGRGGRAVRRRAAEGRGLNVELLPFLAAIGGVAWLFWMREAAAVNLTARLDQALPPHLGQWARELAAAADAT